MTSPMLSTTPAHIQRLVPFLLLSVICFPIGVVSVMADDVPIWAPNTGVGLNTAGVDTVDEITVPSEYASYYLDQWVNFTCNRSFDFDKLTVGGSTSYPADAMTDDTAYPYWVCSDGNFPYGESGTSVYWWAPSMPAEVYIAVGEDDLPLPIPPPPQTQGYRDDRGDWVDGLIIYAVGVDMIQYYEDGIWVNNWNGDTIYVLKGTQVLFKAVKAPSQAPDWPSGKPVWSGSSGASGTGETKTVTFNTKSTTETDYKTVTVECGNVVTINVVVYTLEGIFTPEDNFTDRSQTRYGLEEIVRLWYTKQPTGIPENWMWRKKSGVGSLIGWTFYAQNIAGSTTLKLEITSGPSKGLGPSYVIGIVAPSTSRYLHVPGHENTVAHRTGYASAGILCHYWLDPKDVSFSNLIFGEGSCPATDVLGFYRLCEPWNSYPSGTVHADHPENVFGEILGGNITTGCRVEESDQSHTGEALPFAAGRVTFQIPTRYCDDANTWHTFGPTNDAIFEYTAGGTATVHKGTLSGSATLNAPWSDF